MLTANLVEGGIHFGLGATLAFRQADLHAIGGFAAIADYLADDYELGRRICARKKVQLSAAVVKTHLADYDLQGFISHQLRWVRTIRASRPGGYAGMLLTFTLPWALATLLLSNVHGWSVALLAVAVAFRGSMAVVSSRFVLREDDLRALWLLPVRDVIAMAVWIAGWLGNTITWRGEKFTLKDGKIERS